jgi:hypothetical protein
LNDDPAEEGREDDNGSQLEQNTSDHDASSPFCIANRRLLEGNRCHATADSLDDERYQVNGTEDVQVHCWRDWRCMAAESRDEAAKNNIDACCEERGRLYH